MCMTQESTGASHYSAKSLSSSFSTQPSTETGREAFRRKDQEKSTR